MAQEGQGTVRLRVGGKFMLTYMNHKGRRTVRPIAIDGFSYGAAPPYYPEPQVLMSAWDLERSVLRSFSMAPDKLLEIVPIEPATIDAAAA